MENKKKDKKVVVSGKAVCLVVGIAAGAVGIYWLVRALAFDDTNLPAMLASLVIALFLLTYAARR